MAKDPVPIKDILYFDCDEQYTWIHLNNQKPLLVPLNLNRVVPKDLPGFIAFHDGLLVSKNHIAKLTIQIERLDCGINAEKLTVTLSNTETLICARRTKKNVLESLLLLPVPVVFHVKNTVVISLKRIAVLFIRLASSRVVQFKVKGNIQAITFYPRQYLIAKQKKVCSKPKTTPLPVSKTKQDKKPFRKMPSFLSL